MAVWGARYFFQLPFGRPYCGGLYTAIILLDQFHAFGESASIEEVKCLSPKKYKWGLKCPPIEKLKYQIKKLFLCHSRCISLDVTLWYTDCLQYWVRFFKEFPGFLPSGMKTLFFKKCMQATKSISLKGLAIWKFSCSPEWKPYGLGLI